MANPINDLDAIVQMYMQIAQNQQEEEDSEEEYTSNPLDSSIKQAYPEPKVVKVIAKDKQSPVLESQLYEYTTPDKVDIPNVRTKSFPIPQIYKKSKQVPMENYNEKTWIIRSEMGNQGEMTDEIYNDKMVDIVMYSEALTSIFDINLVNMDEAFNRYVNSMTVSISAIIDVMINYAYTFYPPAKYMLAYLIKAIKYERRALIYLTASPHYDQSMLFDKNNIGECVASLLLENYDDATYDILFPDNDILSKNVTIHNALSSYNNFIQVCNKVGIQYVLNNPSVLHTACTLGEEQIVDYILDQSLTRDYFCSKISDLSILMVASTVQILTKLLQYKHCDSELIEFRNTNGNLVDYLARKNPELLQTLNFNKELLNILPSTLPYLYDHAAILTNIIFHKDFCLDQKYLPPLLDIIAHHPTTLEYIMRNYPHNLSVNCGSETIISYILKYANGIHVDNFIKNNKNILTPYIDILVKKDYDISAIDIDKNMLTRKDIDGYNMFLHLCVNKVDIALKVLSDMPIECFTDIYKNGNPMLNAIFVLCDDIPLLTKIMELNLDLSKVNDDGQNIFLNTIIHNVNNIQPILPYVTEEMFNSIDNYGYNAIQLLAKYGSRDIIKQVVSHKYYDKKMLLQNENILSCIAQNPNDVLDLFDIGIIKDKNCFIHSYKNDNIKLLKLVKVTEEEFLEADRLHNIVQESLNSELSKVHEYILNHEFCTTALIKTKLEKLTSNILVNISKTKHCTKEILMHKISGISILMSAAHNIRSIFDKYVSNIVMDDDLLNLVDPNGYTPIHYIRDSALLEFINKHNVPYTFVFRKIGLKSRILTCIENRMWDLIYSILDHYNCSEIYNEIISNNHNILFKVALQPKINKNIFNRYLKLATNNAALFSDTMSILCYLAKDTDNIESSYDLIKKIIASPIFTENLIPEAFFDHCMMDNSMMEYIVEQHEKITDFSMIISKYIKNPNIMILRYIIDHPDFNKNFLKPELLFLNMSTHIFDLFIPFINEEYLNYKYNKHTLLSYYVSIDDVYKVTKILEKSSVIDSQIVMFCKSIDTYKLITEHKNYVRDSNLNILMNEAIVRFVAGSDIWNTFKNKHDSYGNTYLAYINDVNTMQYLIDKDYIVKNDFVKQGFGNTLLHIANSNIFNVIKSSKLYDENIMLMKNYKGNNVLQERLSKDIEMIDVSKYNNSLLYKKLIGQLNNKKQNALMLLVKHGESITPLKKYVNSLALATDYKGRNVFHYCAKYGNFKNAYKYIKNKDLLEQYDINNETCVMTSCKYDGSILKYLNKLKLLKLDMLYSKSTNKTILFFAKQLSLLKYIIQNVELSNELVQCTRKNKNFLHNIIYDSATMKIILNSKYDLSSLIGPIFLDAVKNNPDTLELILNSKYMCYEYMTLEDGEMNCVEIAFNFQPKSLLLLLKSKFMTPAVMNKENAIGYTLHVELQQIYKDSSMSLLESMNLTQHANIPATSNDKFACDICCLFKKTIRFEPCNHTCCGGCAFKLKVCHLCRGDISSKKIIFDD